MARICGICPVAYQMTAVHAFEDLFGVTIDPSVRALRRLLYCGEWIESHALHVYLLHAPDFLGYPSAVEMAADHPAIGRARRCALKKAGNRIVGSSAAGRSTRSASASAASRARRRGPRWRRCGPTSTPRSTIALETVRWVADPRSTGRSSASRGSWRSATRPSTR